MHALKALAPTLGDHADEVDAGLGAVERAVDRAGDADVGLRDLDLADVAQHPQAIAAPGAAHGGAHAQAALGERPDDLGPTNPEPPKTVTNPCMSGCSAARLAVVAG